MPVCLKHYRAIRQCSPFLLQLSFPKHFLKVEMTHGILLNLLTPNENDSPNLCLNSIPKELNIFFKKCRFNVIYLKCLDQKCSRFHNLRWQVFAWFLPREGAVDASESRWCGRPSKAHCDNFDYLMGYWAVSSSAMTQSDSPKFQFKSYLSSLLSKRLISSSDKSSETSSSPYFALRSLKDLGNHLENRQGRWGDLTSTLFSSLSSSIDHELSSVAFFLLSIGSRLWGLGPLFTSSIYACMFGMVRSAWRQTVCNKFLLNK